MISNQGNSIHMAEKYIAL